MPIKTLLRMLVNNEQTIQKLAESKPIKRAAQLTVYLSHKSKEMGMDNFEKMGERMNEFKDGYQSAMKKPKKK